MSRDVHAEILRTLDEIEREEGVRIVYACESGSRAWGFASRDSDYDIRFVYVHPRDWYLCVESVEERRDVIERPLLNELDVSGWDLRKALRLLRKSNPPLLEWLGSPRIYREVGACARGMREWAAAFVSDRACAYHYLHMARGNFREYLRGEEVSTKKYLYVLRPLLAIRWIEAGLGLVPTEFQRLVEELLPSGPLASAIGDLVARKRGDLELGRGPRIDVISEFLEAELDRHASGIESPQGGPRSIEGLNRIFRATLGEGDADSTQ